MTRINVKAEGIGQGYNTYPVEFSFTINGYPEEWEEGELDRKVLWKAKDKTACNYVRIISVEVHEE